MNKQKKMISTISGLLSLLASNVLFAQTEPQYLNGNQYIFNNENWYLHSSTEDYLVDNNVIIIKYNDNVSDNEIISIERQYSLTRSWKNSQYYKYSIPNGSNLFSTISSINASGIIASIEPDFYFNSGKVTDVGGGTDVGQWHISEVKAPAAWNIASGDENVKVGIIDWWPQWDNPHLGPDVANSYSNVYNNILDPWNTDLIPGTGGDDDNNGFADDYKGWDFNDMDNDVRPAFNYIDHGTMVAGIVSQRSDNTNHYYGIAGGGYFKQEGVKLILTNIGTSWNNTTGGGQASMSNFVAAIYYTANMGAKVINMSYGWNRKLFTPAHTNAMKYAYDKGIVLVAAAGNKGVTEPPQPIIYPACSPFVIGVGGSNHDHIGSVRSCSGREMSVAAPCEDIISTAPNGNILGTLYSKEDGTSFSAPIVSGVAALMLSTNNCMANSQIKDIIENTTWKPSGTSYDANGHSDFLGHGIVDAEAAVTAAHDSYSGTLDLFMKDTPHDFGYPGSNYEEVLNGTPIDNSHDIWVRNNDDDKTVDQTPIYNNASKPVYVYVRIRNKSCVASSSGYDQVSLYWSKAAPWSSWPGGWNGGNGGLVGIGYIPSIQPGQETIVKIPWYMSNPYMTNASLLARIENSSDEGITAYSILFDDVYYNNNIALHKVTILHKYLMTQRPVAERYTPISVYDRNPVQHVPFDLHVYVPGNGTGDILSMPDITRNASVNLYFDDLGWQILSNSGQLDQEGIRIVGDKQIQITQKDITLRGLVFPPGSDPSFSVFADFTFPDGSEDGTQYSYRITQNNSDSPEYNDKEGENFVIYNDLASSSDSMSRKGAAIDSIKYPIQQVRAKTCTINSIAPNPVSENAIISYSIENAKSASLVISQAGGIKIGNYIIDVAKNSTSINMAKLVPGIYTIMLICDGKAIDAKNFQKL